MTIIEILMKFGAQLNVQENMETGGNTPLHMATELNMIQAVKALMSAGAEPDIRN